MNSEWNDRTNLINQARELLSPYLDNEITPTERALVETILAESPELQRELDSLRQTVNLLRWMPAVPAPRPFTLTEADASLATVVRPPFWSTWLKPMMGAVAALAAIVIVGVYLFRSNPPPPASQEAANVALAPAAPAIQNDEVVIEQTEEGQSMADSATELSQDQSQAAKQEAVQEAAPLESMTATEEIAAGEVSPTDQDTLRQTAPEEGSDTAMAGEPAPLPTTSPGADLQAFAAPPPAAAVKEAQPASAGAAAEAEQPAPEAAANPAAEIAPLADEQEAVSEAESAASEAALAPEALEATVVTDQAAVPTEAPAALPAPLIGRGGGIGLGGGGPAVAPPETETEQSNPFAKIALIIGAIFLIGVIILGIFSGSSPRKR